MKYVKAKKIHTCHLCYRVIPKGHRYFRVVEKSVGVDYDRHEHNNCELYVKRLTAEVVNG